MWLRNLAMVVPLLAVAGCGGRDATRCPAFDAGVKEPVGLETPATRLPGGANIEALIVDDTGLYWYDANGAILSLPRGQSQAVELRPAQVGFAGRSGPATEFALVINGFTSDTDRLYWGEGNRYVGVDAGSVTDLFPPGRLLSIAKSGGPESLLLQLPDRPIRPVVASGNRLIVHVGNAFYQLLEGTSELEALVSSPPPETSRVIGDKIYWTEPDQEEPRLFRVGFDEAEPELVARIEGSDFEVGPGYILWRQERLRTEPALVLDQNFVVRRESTGCTQPLPGLGESLSFSTAPDAQHVYWYSFNALGAVSASTPSPGAGSESHAAPPALPVMPLIRANLATGALERLDTPGFALHLGEQIVGQDAEQLFLSTNTGIAAVRKPSH